MFGNLRLQYALQVILLLGKIRDLQRPFTKSHLTSKRPSQVDQENMIPSQGLFVPVSSGFVQCESVSEKEIKPFLLHWYLKQN